MRLESKEILRSNVKALMRHHWDGVENISQLARLAKINQGGAQRVLDRTSLVQLDKLEKVADVFGIPPWMLLVPRTASRARS